MTSTRYPQAPMQIYQDAFDQAPMPSIQVPTSSKDSSALRAVWNISSRTNTILNPSHPSSMIPSPLKPLQPNYSQSPSRASFGNFSMIQMPAPDAQSCSADYLQERQPTKTQFHAGPHKTSFTAFVPSNPMGKENYPQHHNSLPQNSYTEDYSYNNYAPAAPHATKPTLKRSLMEAAPITETRPSKKIKMDRLEQVQDVGIGSPQDLPLPQSFPDIIDDGQKPSHSYAQLIGMAILRAPRRRLTLAQIYKWISGTYAFYGKEEAAGWQNSIRHNLSLNKAFVKQERPKDDPGKGNYWAIQIGMEHQFIKEKNLKMFNPMEASSTAEHSDGLESSQHVFSALSPSVENLSHSQSDSNEPSPSIANGPSSDATISASEFLEDVEEPANEVPPSSPFIQSSPPTALMQSSPPVARGSNGKHYTPSAVLHFPTSSIARSHKRKFASMDDSGYFSSLDSSALRHARPGSRMASDFDRPRIKRGRAEEEIARLRGSSHDSLTGTRDILAMGPPTSSPIQAKHILNKMPPPLTPAVKLKPPVRPPPSVSPNTNLRMHRAKVRELIGSPLRDIVSLDEQAPYSPAFDLEAGKRLFEDFKFDYTPVDNYQALSDQFWFPQARTASLGGSPIKHPAKRPCLERSKSASVLGDVSNSNLNKITNSVVPTPGFKYPPVLASSDYIASGSISPRRKLGIAPPPKVALPSLHFDDYNLAQENFDQWLTEDGDEMPIFDLLNKSQFPKIGSLTHSRNASRSTIARPPLHGNNTSLF